jgi:hypothetical protein
LFRRLIPDRISEHLHGRDVSPQASSILVRYQGRVQLAVKANTSQRQFLLNTIIVREGWILRSIGLDSGHFEDGERLLEIQEFLTASGQRAGNRVSSCHQGGKAHRAYQTNLWRWSELFQRFCRKHVVAKLYTPNFKSSPPRQDKDPGGPPGGLIPRCPYEATSRRS